MPPTRFPASCSMRSRAPGCTGSGLMSASPRCARCRKRFASGCLGAGRRVAVRLRLGPAVGSQAAQIALVWITGRQVIDRALLRHDTHRLWIVVGAIVALGFVRAALMLGRRLLSGKQALDVEMDLRSGMYAHLVRLSFGFYDRHQTGQLMSRATVDLQGVRFFLGYGLIFFFQNVLTVLS